LHTRYFDRYGDHVFYRDVNKGMPVIVRGEGAYLYDDSGKRYLDGCAGSQVANIGHGLAEIADAISEQARTVAFTHLSRFTTEPVMHLAQMVAALAPGDLERVYFVSGGSEAVEAAIKLVRTYFVERDGASTTKHRIIARWHSFHGNTLGALSATGHIPRRRKYAPMLVDFPHIPTCYCYRCHYGLTYPACGVACVEALDEALARYGAENVAAFIAEPLVGAASGAVPPVDEYWPMIREICTRNDVLLIADEVMTGFGRTGADFAVDHWGVVPDVISCAKGMSAGYSPLGAIIVREDLHEVIRRGSGRFTHGHTYGGNPLSAAAGVAVLDYYRRHDLKDNSKRLGELMFRLMEPLAASPIVGDVRGRGLFMGVELVADKVTRRPFPAETAIGEQLTRKCMDHGLVVYPGSGHADGKSGDHILVGPPLTITAAQVHELVGSLAAGLRDLELELGLSELRTATG
jgi:adenosylmethionine-8-amino-7-oxononanoate aminotransferase